MFNALRKKMVALAAFAASLVRGNEKPNHGPEVTHMKDPSFRVIESRRHREGKPVCGRDLENYHDSKLGKRFAEAPYRSVRGY